MGHTHKDQPTLEESDAESSGSDSLTVSFHSDMSVKTLIKHGRKAQHKINLQKQGKAHYRKKLADKTNSQAQKSSFGKK
ncbi:hypothetical protein M422DRAFT_267722 [Sphaerobolus stellatus SS14]|uniref:Uncharacterized protein n=1 Tax=Sphaerobolus stellatus (strain SS14) TaxID=990650 RepID=A0A0C9UZ34_SPHS4|nr:hypothetical protein M422DRAFT_267722 [Sphaerobolus stellatus SS14]